MKKEIQRVIKGHFYQAQMLRRLGFDLGWKEMFTGENKYYPKISKILGLRGLENELEKSLKPKPLKIKNQCEQKQEGGMKTYLIETGNYKQEFSSTSLVNAVIEAFKKNPPENPSRLTRCRAKYPLTRKQGDGLWHYIDTIAMLKKAGYQVKS